MKNKISEVIKNLIGLKCCKVKIGYAQVLILGFGDLIEEKKYNRFSFSHGQWELTTYSCVWRVEYNTKIICGNFDEPRHVTPLLETLLTKKVISLVQVNLQDIKLEFEDGYSIYFFGQSSIDEHLHISTPDNKYVLFTPDKGWIELKSGVKDSLNAKEEFISTLSEECHHRWADSVVQSSSNNFCRDCIYYRPLRGEFYFWDYGICSCKVSKYDSKLVSIKSGCISYKENIDN